MCKGTGVDNNMTDFFNTIKEYAEKHPEKGRNMAKWGTEVAPVGTSLLYINKE